MQERLREQLKQFPRQKDMAFSLLRLLWQSMVRGFVKSYHRLSVSGKEHLPGKEQSFIVVANHTSHLDVLCLSSALPLKKIGKTYAVAAKDYFFSSFWSALFSSICINALPFDRHKSAREGLSYCADALKKKNQTLLLFPEGTRSLSGEIRPFKPGIGYLLAGSSIPVVPAYIEGAYRAWPKGRYLPLPRKVRIHFSKPVTFSHVERNKEGFARIAKELEETVQKIGASWT